MDTPLLSAIVLNYRTPQATVRCVQALLEQIVDGALEVIVVDNHSQDDSIGTIRARFSHDARVRIVETHVNNGYGQGNSFGVSFARGRFVLIVNPDNTLPPQAAQRMVSYLQEHHDVGIVAPKLQFSDGTMRASFRHFPGFLELLLKRTPLKHIFTRRVDHYLQQGVVPQQPLTVDWVVGACFCMRRSLFEQLHGFDPRFFLFFEDMDLCRRTAQAEYRVVYHPGIVVYDARERLSGEGLLPLFCTRAGRMHLVSAVKYFAKWRGSPMELAMGSSHSS